MGVHIGSGLSLGFEARAAAAEAAMQARRGLAGEPADLALVFCSGEHLADPEAVLEGVHEALAPATLAGCGAGGVLAEGQEVEGGTAVCVWAASLGGGSAAAFHASLHEVAEGTAVVGLPDLRDAGAAVMLPDPYSFPTDLVLRELSALAPNVPVLGGLASGRTADDRAVLLVDRDVVDTGAVGVRLDGVELLPCVSQGATPLGPELTITAAEGHVIGELAGRPALEKLREVVSAFDDAERDLVAGGLLLGVVIDGNKPDYEQGDFLVRGLIGADPDAGGVAVGAGVEPGQVVRVHARDARSADRDLRQALHLRRAALGGKAPAGALIFTCNGRGVDLFGVSGHDAEALEEELAGAPAAGFFAAGEIGPVGGENFVHAFSATVAVFPA